MITIIHNCKYHKIRQFYLKIYLSVNRHFNLTNHSYAHLFKIQSLRFPNLNGNI